MGTEWTSQQNGSVCRESQKGQEEGAAGSGTLSMSYSHVKPHSWWPQQLGVTLETSESERL